MKKFKDIPGYDGLYQVSEEGEILSLSKNLNRCGTMYLRGDKLLRQQVNGGRKFVGLMKNGIQKKLAVHRLVALAFIPNPENKPEINHKDGNPLNNKVDNLEWSTRIENQRHAFKNGFGKYMPKNHPAVSKPVSQYKDGVLIAKFPSVAEVYRKTGYAVSNIVNCANNKKSLAYGYKWKYEN